MSALPVGTAGRANNTMARPFDMIDGQATAVLGDESSPKSTVRIGGDPAKTGGKFIPQTYVRKFYDNPGDTKGDECWLSINHKATNVSNQDRMQVQDGVLAQRSGDVEHRYYITDDGSLEHEIVFHERPKGNFIELEVRHADGVSGYHQPALTDDEIKEGCNRPENVIDSIAWYYAKQHNRVNADTGEVRVYQTGKIGHWMRPQFIDAKGNKAWARQIIIPVNATTDTIRISWDADWMASASLPVTLDPTYIGQTNAPASTVQYGGAGKIVATGTYAGASGSATYISLYVGDYSGGHLLTPGFWADATSYPGAAVGAGAEIATGAAMAWKTGTIVSPPAISATNYWIGYHAEGSANPNFGYDSTAPTVACKYKAQSGYSAGTVPAFPAGASSFSSYRFGAYITYTASGGGSKPWLYVPRRSRLVGVNQ